MKSKLLIIFLSLFSLVSMQAFAYESSTQPRDQQAAQGPLHKLTSPKDGEIIAILITSNKNEIAAAEEASTKHLSPEVKDFSNMLHKDHEKNLNDTIELSNKIGVQPINTPAVTMLKQKGQKLLSKLQPLDNKQFEVTYVNAMIKSHQEGLARLDKAIRSAKNPELKKHLEMTKGAVANHLRIAKDVKNKIQS